MDEIAMAIARAQERAIGSKLPGFLDAVRIALAPRLELPEVEPRPDLAEIITPNFGNAASQRAGLLQKIEIYLADAGEIPDDIAQEAREAGIDVTALCDNGAASTTGGTP